MSKQTQKQNKKEIEWEKEFDKLFVGSESGFDDWLEKSSGRKIKSFIRDLLLKQKKELMKKLDKKSK